MGRSEFRAKQDSTLLDQAVEHLESSTGVYIKDMTRSATLQATIAQEIEHYRMIQNNLRDECMRIHSRKKKKENKPWYSKICMRIVDKFEKNLKIITK